MRNCILTGVEDEDSDEKTDGGSGEDAEASFDGFDYVCCTHDDL